MPFSGRVCVCVVCSCLLVVSHGGLIEGETVSFQFPLEKIEDRLPSKQGDYQRTVDIIVVVDNSGSMGLEILSLQETFYDHMVAPQIGDGIDVHVIVVSRHGDNASESVCFEEPLSSIPAGGCDNPPNLPGITDMFKHYSVEIGSHDSWCLLMDTFDGSVPDEFGLEPLGWSVWLREGALKLILTVSDDGVTCGTYGDGDSIAGGTAAANAIDADLLALSPLHFGTTSHRNYVVHSLVGLDSYTVPDEPWPPSDPMTTLTCVTAIASGTGHQGLSILTEVLRFPVCSTTEYDQFFDAVSLETIALVPLFSDGFESGDTDVWSSVAP